MLRPKTHAHQLSPPAACFQAPDRESETQDSLAAATADASLQVPAGARAPEYEDTGSSEAYKAKSANDRFPEGTEIR